MPNKATRKSVNLLKKYLAGLLTGGIEAAEGGLASIESLSDSADLKSVYKARDNYCRLKTWVTVARTLRDRLKK
jgi:hypothetical protein